MEQCKIPSTDIFQGEGNAVEKLERQLRKTERTRDRRIRS